MNLEQRHRLEDKLFKAINNFEERDGVSVKEVRLKKFNISGEGERTERVKVEVEG